MNFLQQILTKADEKKLYELNEKEEDIFDSISIFAEERNIDEALLLGCLSFSNLKQEENLPAEAREFLTQIKKRKEENAKQRNAIFDKRINAYFKGMNQESIYQDAIKWIDSIPKEEMDDTLNRYDSLSVSSMKSYFSVFPTTPREFLVKYICKNIEEHGAKLDEAYLLKIVNYVINKVSKEFPNIKPVANQEPFSLKVEDCFKRTLQTDDKRKTVTPIKRASHYSMLNSKVSAQVMPIQDYLYDSFGQYSFLPVSQDILAQVKVSKANAKKEVFTHVMIDYQGDEIEYNKARIKPFDENVLNTICSIMQAGNTQMTIHDIFRTMKGITGSTRSATKEQADKIRLSIMKLAATRIYIDFTDELNNKFLLSDDERLASGVYDDMLLVYKGFKAVTVAGKETYLLSITETPILYAYAHAKGQLATYETKYLNVPCNENENLTNIKFYLLKHIHNIKKGIFNNPHINFDEMYKKVGINKPTKEQARRDRSYIVEMLDYWKKEDLFKDYEFYKEGKSIAGIKITIK